MFVLSMRYVSCKQQTVKFCFLIQLTILCFLIRESRPLTFSVNIERHVIVPAILLLFLFIYLYIFIWFSVFWFYWSFRSTQVFNLHMIHNHNIYLLNFASNFCAFSVLSKNPLPNPRWQKCISMHSSKGIIVLTLILLELLFCIWYDIEI
jgi:hypothetical protein